MGPQEDSSIAAMFDFRYLLQVSYGLEVFYEPLVSLRVV